MKVISEKEKSIKGLGRHSCRKKDENKTARYGEVRNDTSPKDAESIQKVKGGGGEDVEVEKGSRKQHQTGA